MFRKLLKNDLKTAWKFLWVLWLMALSAAAVGVGMMRIISAAENTTLIAVGTLTMMAVAFTIFGSWVASLFLLLGSFYKSRFTDQGYLTFTLPVSTHDVLLSSYLTSALGIVVSALVTVLSFGILLFFGISDFDGQRVQMIGMCFQRLPELIDIFGGWNIVLFAVYILVAALSELVTVMLAITIGAAIAKKHKIFSAIAVYYGIHMVLSFIYGTGLVATSVTTGKFQYFLLGQSGLFLVFGLGAYFLMHYLVNKKLNLN